MSITNSNERMLRLLQATPKQLAMIDRVLEGKVERDETKPMRSGPLTMMVKQAADYLGVHRATIRRLINAGRLRTAPLLGSERVLREDVEAIAYGGKAERRVQNAERGAAA